MVAEAKGELRQFIVRESPRKTHPTKIIDDFKYGEKNQTNMNKLKREKSNHKHKYKRAQDIRSLALAYVYGQTNERRILLKQRE